MKEEKNNFENLTENLKEYVNTRYDIVTLKVTQKAAEISSQTVAILLIGMGISFFLLLTNMALAFYISSLLDNNYVGFFIVAGFYLLLSIILIWSKQKLIIVPLRNFIIKQ